MNVVVLNSFKDCVNNLQSFSNFEELPVFRRFWNECGIIARIEYALNSENENLVKEVRNEVKSYISIRKGWGVDIYTDKREDHIEYHKSVIKWIEEKGNE
jgi:hypothetical protein